MLKDKRKIIKIGGSKAITLPPIVQGEFVSIAANRLMLVDPRGQIPEDVLLEFLEAYVEPAFWIWLKKKLSQKTQ